MYQHINPKNHQAAPLIAEDIYNIVMQVCEPSLGVVCTLGNDPVCLPVSRP